MAGAGNRHCANCIGSLAFPVVSDVLWSVGHDLSCANMTEQAGHKPGKPRILREYFLLIYGPGWLGSRVVSMLNSGAEGPGFKSQPRCCRVTGLGKLIRPVVPPFTEQRN